MVGIICFWDRLATPYLDKYERLLKSLSIEYEVVFWVRKQTGKSEIIYRDGEVAITSKCAGSLIRKVSDFILWRHNVLKVIKNRKYDHLIVLTTVPAVLLRTLLIGKYKDKYVFDIRDYTFERIAMFRKLVMTIIKRSSITAISSMGYMRWLDSNPKIMVNHNITITQPQAVTGVLKGKRPVRFAFVGNVRLDTQTEALMKTMSKYREMEQHFYGRVLPNCPIEKITREQSIKNIQMHGAFTVLDKADIYKDVDLINCVYANAETEAAIPLGDSTPLPNRLYDSLIFKTPMVASSGTYLSELIIRYNLGCSVNGFDSNAVNTILNYVDTFDKTAFEQGANTLLEIVKDEERRFIEALNNVLNRWKQKDTEVRDIV